MNEKILSEIASEIAKVVAEKNEAYGSSLTSTGSLIRTMLLPYYDFVSDRYTLPSEIFDQLPVVIRVLDKLNRILANPTGDKMGESPWMDIMGYALLMLAQRKIIKSGGYE